MAESMSKDSSNGCHVITSIPKYSYTFRWTVKNFKEFPVGQARESPKFHIQPKNEFRASLKLPKCLDAYLRFHLVSGPAIEINHRLLILKCDGQVLLGYKSKHKYSDDALQCNVMPICVEEMKKAREDDVLIIKCIMEYSLDMKDEIYFFKNHSKPEIDMSTLLDGIKSIYNKSTYDNVLQLRVGKEVLTVHKSFVCDRSSVLSRMFETAMVEREKNEVVITDLELSVVKDFVAYMYTGVLINDDFESVYALYYAADKYDVPCLRKTCSDVLLSQLDVQKAFSVLALADRHSDVPFKKSVEDFIKCNF